MRAAVLVLIVLSTAFLRAESPAEMKPYAGAIPGTDVKFEMVPIPGGTFMMGSPESEPGRGPDEGPQHPVEVKAMWVGKYEVTWDEYDIFAFQMDIKKRKDLQITTLPPTEKSADAVTRPTPPYADMTFGKGHTGNPAICMTHHAAMEYTRWLSAKTGKEYRLLTEAEWEYACRAGTKTACSFGDDPKDLGEYAWFTGNSNNGPKKVGQKKPNAWGLYDMHGNVSEWVLDHYKKDYFAQFSKDKATLQPFLAPDDQEYPYVSKGGSWDDKPKDLRSAVRKGSDDNYSLQDPQLPQSIWWHTDAQQVGFRLCRPLEEQENLKGFKSPIKRTDGR
jgi:formylglycine-generating enzyme required for sulfatase activity